MNGTLPYWRLSGFYFFYFSLLGATAPFLALYFDHLGFSAARIGELIAIPMLMRCIAPNIWGWLGDYSGRRLAIVRFGALCTLLCFAGIFISQSYAWLALIMALHAFFWHAVLPQFEVITFAHLKEQAARYSQIRLWGSIGFIVAVVGLGKLFELLSLDAYPWALILIMAGIVLSSWWVPNAQPQMRPNTQEQGGFLQQLRRPGILAFYLSVGLMQLSNGPYYTFLSLHLEALGYARGVIGQLWALGVLAEIVLFMLMARLLARYSLRTVLLASFLITAAALVAAGQPGRASAGAAVCPADARRHLWQLPCGGHAFCPAQLCRPPARPGPGAVCRAWPASAGPLGALYSGYSWHSLGAAWTFAIASLIALAAAVITARYMRDERP